jgi:hypothetical protein
VARRLRSRSISAFLPAADAGGVRFHSTDRNLAKLDGAAFGVMDWLL